MPASTDRLADALARPPRRRKASDPPVVRLRQGVVQAVAAGPPATVTVAVSGVAVPGVPRFAFYTTPVVGETIWLLYQGRTPMALGPLAP